MLYNIPCRIYILSTLSLCISGIVSTATATSSETKISNEETLVVTTGFAPIFPDICYHLTHYKPAAADIPV
ncbi:hypothetical protein, partial [Escherichia coli]|uniref:hypothetical protein n=1 Tax=Escherichia coli TaxID=562 RepID=UPI0012FFA5AB